MRELNVREELREWMGHAVLSSPIVGALYNHFLEGGISKEEMLVSMVVGLYRENQEVREKLDQALRGEKDA